MCIIAVSKKGVKQPSLDQLRTMFNENPDGAGFMFARDHEVTIHKGFMTFEDFSRAVKEQKFTAEDPVVYHFRISTQAGIQPTMTHPFPLTSDLETCEKLDLICPVGIAHNGVIQMTSSAKETRYSDTAFFITDYMTKLIRNKADITDHRVLRMIEMLTRSKWAIMDGFTGEIALIGTFIDHKGLLFSNGTFMKRPQQTTIIPPKGKWSWDDYKNGYYGNGYDGTEWR